MTTMTFQPGFGSPAFPARRCAPRGATPRARRVAPAVYRRRRLACLAAAIGFVGVLGQAGAALGGAPLAPPERRPAVASAADTVEVVVRPGDTLWSIATRLAPDADPRPTVDTLSRARHGAPLIPGEVLQWPRHAA